MDNEIQFGDLAEETPRQQLRPDQNKHFAVVRIGPLDENELPIFVDLDVMSEMEAHAVSDPTVELGGVLLGGCHHDSHGRPFVIVRDSLRAQHFESTKGSFKFTHDTWSAITREREQFSDELAMVGWYHTHPDWGVFLSGMDMFICDNFFNKPLDVALVIDPCRQDRGWFQWTGDPQNRIRRTQGFFLTSSRFRQGELEQYAAAWEGKRSMPIDTRSSSSVGPGHVVHVTTERSTGLLVAVIGMLVLQFCFVALIALRMLAPAADSTSNKEVVEALKKMVESREADAKRAGREELMDKVISELAQAPKGTFRTMTDLQQRNQELSGAVRGQLAREHELELLVDQQKNMNEKSETLLSESKKKNENLQAKYDKQVTELSSLRKRLKEADPEKGADKDAEKDAEKESLAEWFTWPRIAMGGGLVVLALVTGALWWKNAAH